MVKRKSKSRKPQSGRKLSSRGMIRTHLMMTREMRDELKAEAAASGLTFSDAARMRMTGVRVVVQPAVVSASPAEAPAAAIEEQAVEQVG